MRGLITDRNRDNVLRRAELARKGKRNWTDEEAAEWYGSPQLTVGANLFPPGPFYSSAVELKFRDDAIVATTSSAGIYQYAISIIGEASAFVGNTYTLSVDFIGTVDGGTPQIALYWHDDSGYDFAGASLSEAGSVTITFDGNPNGRSNLAAYIYVTTDVAVEAGSSARFSRVRLTRGSEKHEYVPYTEVIATPTTKGAYNYSDLNRVERAVAEISDLYGLNLVTKTDWKMWDIPKYSDMNRYLSNILVIRRKFAIPIHPSGEVDGITYTDANYYERILADCFVGAEVAPRSGDLLCGEF